jgi:RNA polymerase sigma factor (sigma-70 family)
MTDRDLLAREFEANRDHLLGVAYRMLGSRSDAEDAVQDAWLRLSRSDAGEIANLGGWLRTVVARVCLDVLRARRARPHEPLDERVAHPRAGEGDAAGAEQEMLLAESVGLAMLVVLDRLSPAERVAFVLHDMFDLSFDEIAPVVGRNPAAARQLASRARRRVRGGHAPTPDRARQREVVEAYLAASRSGSLDALLAVLAPEVVLRADAGPNREVRGAAVVAGLALAYPNRRRFAHPAWVDGRPGIVVAPLGRLQVVLAMTVDGNRIAEIEVVTDRERLARLDVAML